LISNVIFAIALFRLSQLLDFFIDMCTPPWLHLSFYLTDYQIKKFISDSYMYPAFKTPLRQAGKPINPAFVCMISMFIIGRQVSQS